MRSKSFIVLALNVVVILVTTTAVAQELTSASDLAIDPSDTANADAPADVLSTEQWRRVDAAVERALLWLASQQQEDGSFPTQVSGQPGVTSLCSLAFMAHGHLPGEADFGARIDRGTDYVLKCQKKNGLISVAGPSGPRLTRSVSHEVGNCAAYNHAVSSLTLSELYGSSEETRAERIKEAVNRAIIATLEMQRWPKDRPQDRGGWRYVDDFDNNDSDLSITGWNLQFLRSARNAGFNVPKKPIDDAVAYVRSCFSREYGTFLYTNNPVDGRSRGMAGAGVLALAHAGFHKSPESQITGNWILANSFQNYNEHLRFTSRWEHDRYHYGLFHCCQGMYQLGGRHWEAFFPPVVETLLANQQADGSWPAESHKYDGKFGNAYTTALVLLALGAPNQLLPIYQR
jgi:hypothetical protein